MGGFHAVDMLEHCRISPPYGSVSTTSLPLTFFDIKWLHLPPVTCILFYEFHHSKDYFIQTILPNLKHTLSLTLQYFFAFSGNLTWFQDSIEPMIQYIDGDSVAFTVCESDYDFHHLSGNHSKEANLLFPLIPELVTRSGVGSFPLLAIQVTFFSNKGISIGLTHSHTTADGRMFSHFLKVWALVSKLQGDTSFMSESPLCYDRSLVHDPNGNSLILLDYFEKCNITKETFNIPRGRVVPIGNVLATFRLSCDDIKWIKQMILTRFVSQKTEDAPTQISTFVSVCAYVWVCLVEARWGGAVAAIEDDPMEYFIFQVDFRARLHPPLPDTYFGNCLTSAVVGCNRSDLIGKDGIWTAAKLLMNVIQNIGKEDKITKSMETFYSAPGRVVTVAGTPKLGFYQTDFGWGTPKKIDVTSIAGTEAVSLFECPNEKGAVEVGLSRMKTKMNVFASLFVKTVQNYRQCNV